MIVRILTKSLLRISISAFWNLCKSPCPIVHFSPWKCFTKFCWHSDVFLICFFTSQIDGAVCSILLNLSHHSKEDLSCLKTHPKRYTFFGYSMYDWTENVKANKNIFMKICKGKRLSELLEAFISIFCMTAFSCLFFPAFWNLCKSPCPIVHFSPERDAAEKGKCCVRQGGWKEQIRKRSERLRTWRSHRAAEGDVERAALGKSVELCKQAYTFYRRKRWRN